MADADRTARINRMYRWDVLVALLFVLALWAALGFVAWKTWDLAPNDTARWLLLGAGGLVVLFNTASIGAMIAHYSQDKEFIYGLDIKHLDEMRNRSGG